MALLLPWPLVLQILSFAIRRVEVDEIKKGKSKGGLRIACNGSKRCRRCKG
jgi:hypothetical protein